MNQQWPVAALDPVRRLRVAASAVGGTFADARVDYPVDEVWSVVSDLEGELHRLLPDIRTTRVLAADPSEPRLQALAVGYLGQRARFDVELEQGWCWMQSRFLLCGFAATREDGGTRYAFLGGTRNRKLPGMAPLLRRPGHAYATMVVRRIEQRVRAIRQAA